MKRKSRGISIYLKPEHKDFISYQATIRGLSNSDLVRLAVAHLCGDLPNGDQAVK